MRFMVSVSDGGADWTTAGFKCGAERPEPDTEEGESTASSSGAIIHSDDSDLTISCSGNTHHV